MMEGRCRMYQYQCEKCGARLDPGEHCDCEGEVKHEMEHRESFYKEEAGKNHLCSTGSMERVEV